MGKVDTSYREVEGSQDNPLEVEDIHTYNDLAVETFCKHFHLTVSRQPRFLLLFRSLAFYRPQQLLQ